MKIYFSWTLWLCFMCEGLLMDKIHDRREEGLFNNLQALSNASATDSRRASQRTIRRWLKDEKNKTYFLTSSPSWSDKRRHQTEGKVEHQRRISSRSHRWNRNNGCQNRRLRGRARCRDERGRRAGLKHASTQHAGLKHVSADNIQYAHGLTRAQGQADYDYNGIEEEYNSIADEEYEDHFKVVTERQMLSTDEASLRRERGFSKWSRWTQCSKRCLTYRRRRCRRPVICGKKVIRETAYCYIEGTYCHRWIVNKIERKKDRDHYTIETIHQRKLQGAAVDVNTNLIETERQEQQQQQQCGQLYGGARRGERLRERPWDMMRIIGGRPTPKGKWPWQVIILNRYKEPYCGGTLVSLRWVITAAHCVRKRMFVRIGEHDLKIKDEHEMEMRITEAIIHPNYDPDIVDSDLAMLKLPVLARPEKGHSIVCLPHPGQSLPVDRLCTIVGWGKRRITDDLGTDILHEAQIPVVSTSTCRNTYMDYLITRNMFCAGYKKGRMDSCAGDSGGPLLCRNPTHPEEPWTIFGITSFGEGCGKKGKYGIYTRIPNYIEWINSVVKNSYYAEESIHSHEDHRSSYFV